MAGSGVIYKLIRPVADAFVDAAFDRIFEPKRIESEAADAGDDLVPAPAARAILEWLYGPNEGGAEPDYAPQSLGMGPIDRGGAAPDRAETSDDGHPAGVGGREPRVPSADGE